MMQIVDPNAFARGLREAIKAEVAEKKLAIKLVGILPEGAPGPSKTYARYTELGCEAVGFDWQLRTCSADFIESELTRAQMDEGVDGVLIYYPVNAHLKDDVLLRESVPARIDVEGLSTFWIDRLYRNDRHLDAEARLKAILPCTPLAIIKILEHILALEGETSNAPFAGRIGKPSPYSGLKAVVFNRSEVVGRPLASMLRHDGADTLSFDEHGPVSIGQDGKQLATEVTREQALAEADIVITGVPSRSFPLVQAKELKKGAICINFSTLKNFSEDIAEKASYFVPRIGPMTIAMVLRNTLRLHTHKSLLKDVLRS